MSKATITHVEPGSTADATQANTDYTEAEIASGLIEGENTRNEWCSTKHMDNVTLPITRMQNVVDATSVAYANAGFVDLNAGAVTLTPNWTVQSGEAVRMHFSCHQVAVTRNTPAEIDYIFRFYVNGADQYGCEYGYSIASSQQTSANRIKFWKPTFSYLYVNTTGAPVSINSVTVQIKCPGATPPSVTIENCDLTLIYNRY